MVEKGRENENRGKENAAATAERRQVAETNEDVQPPGPGGARRRGKEERRAAETGRGTISPNGAGMHENENCSIPSRKRAQREQNRNSVGGRGGIICLERSRAQQRIRNARKHDY